MCSDPRPSRGRTIHRGALGAALAATCLLATVAGNGPKFFPDDPLRVDDDRAMDARGVQPTRLGEFEDISYHTLRRKGDIRDVAAMNTNSIDEVPDSSWFQNRFAQKPMDLGELTRGPDRFPTLSIDGWPIVEGKGQGLQAGFRVRDPEGHLYQIKFDPTHRPELSTAAEIIGTTFFHAFGYNVADEYLVEFDPDKTVIAPGSVIRDGGGRERALVKRDIEDALVSAARLESGRYRGIASRFIDGTPLGPFRYWGTRSDDPNDIVPHEHRRELRGMRVFAAWLNHDEADSTNTLDALVEADGRHYVRHYLLDFGSVAGSDTTRDQRGRSGNEYLFEWGPGLKTAATLGFYMRPWLLVDYPQVPPAVGLFEAEAFDPIAWKPVYPNPAFDNMRAEDAFWAARIVARFDDQTIRAIVEKARYSDPRSTEYMTRTLTTRRDKVLGAWLTAVTPIVAPALDPSGRLTFSNAAVDAKVSTPPPAYRVQAFRFDNADGRRTPLGDVQPSAEPAVTLPAIDARPGDYVGVAITADHPDHPSWSRPATIYFRRQSTGGWELVGIER